MIEKEPEYKIIGCIACKKLFAIQKVSSDIEIPTDFKCRYCVKKNELPNMQNR